MEYPTYGLTKNFPNLSYDSALEKAVEALKSEGFGVLTEIDVKKTLKKKINVDFKRYAILGACNPTLAHGALTEDPFIGLLLPCNVVVMEKEEGGSTVSIINPKEMFKIVDNPALRKVAAEVETKLNRVLDQI